MKRNLSRIIIVLSLLFLFFVGIYLGDRTSYSISVDNEETREGNASDDVLFLNGIEFEKNEAKAGDKIDVKFDTAGASLDGATINLVRTDGKYNISLNVKSVYEKPFVEIPKYVNNGDYVVKSVSLVGNNSDGSTFTKNFTENPKGSDDVLFKFTNKIKLEADPTNIDIDLIKNIKLSTSNFRPGSKVKLEIDYDKDIRVVRLNFSLGTYTMYSYINAIATSPYIIIPQSAKIGEYVLNEIYVETYNHGSVSYSFDGREGTKYLAYDSRYYVLSENNSEEENVYYNNEEITNEVVSQIHSSEIIKRIEIMSEDNSTISEDIFAAIKGLDKELVVHYKDVKYVFKGKDIEKEKTFNASVNYNLINKDNDFSKYVSDGLVIEFAANGQLPGKAKVTLEKNSLFNKAFKQDHVNVYYYNEESKKFELIKEDLIIGKDAISFEIAHTSTYIVTNSKISESVVYSASTEKAEKKSIKLSKDNILIIIIAVLAVIIVILIIVLVSSKDKEVVKEKEEEIPEEETDEELVDGYEDFDEEDLRENISKANENSFEDEDE